MIEEKKMLRRFMRTCRRSCGDRSQLDQRITEQFLKSEIYHNSGVLLIYASFDAEVSTDAIIANALADSKCVCLPRCSIDSNRMDFYSIKSLSELKADAFGILAPEEKVERLFTGGTDAVCVVPGLAFTRQGERIGYGKGYYDAFLEKNNVCTVGLCYEFQVVDTIPTETHDKRMQYLCTEKGLHRCNEIDEK